MHLTKHSVLILSYYIFILIFWLYLQINGITSGEIGYYYQFAFGLVPLLGGVLGLIRANQWGLFKSKVGTALSLLSLGLIMWGIGQMFWSIFYNIILKIEIPYPSLADYFYIISWPIWFVGMIYLSKATGAKFSLKKVEGKAILFIIPAILIAASYYLLITVARGGTLTTLDGDFQKIFFDLAYPTGDVVILTTTILIFGLSFKYLGGKYLAPIIIILLAFILNYITDFNFALSTTQGVYYNGHWVDMLYPTVLTMLSIGISQFSID